MNPLSLSLKSLPASEAVNTNKEKLCQHFSSKRRSSVSKCTKTNKIKMKVVQKQLFCSLDEGEDMLVRLATMKIKEKIIIKMEMMTWANEMCVKLCVCVCEILFPYPVQIT